MQARKLFTFLTILALSATVPVWAQPPQGPPLEPEIGHAIHFDVSAPLPELIRMYSLKEKAAGRLVVVPNRKYPPLNSQARVEPDPVVQTQEIGDISVAATPQPSSDFEGLSDDDNAAIGGFRIVPPDTEGDVSADFYLQSINLISAFYDKNTGLPAGTGPFLTNAIWAGKGDICETNNDGDPIAFYDHLADRWVFSQFALVIGGGGTISDSFECVAVSSTSNPFGTYNRYTFPVSPRQFIDYPKLGTWTDGYYMTVNEFGKASFRGAVAVAFERDAMIAGDPNARFIKFGPLSCGSTCFFSLQPGHLEGPAPAAGTPNTFVMSWDDETWGSGSGPDGYQLWNFAVDWSAGTGTFTQLPLVTTPEFSANLCGFAECARQPAPGERLDTLSQFTMFRAQRRSFATHETLVVNHTVNVGGDVAGIRWAELRSTDGGQSWSLFQTGTYAPADGNDRFMGSAAMDASGNIGLSYTVSGTGTFASVAYTSRAATDPPGTMPGGEVVLVAGSDVQVNSFNRWGDYSTLSVDPADGCTFWLTNEYQANDDTRQDFDFKTRIGSFSLAECAPPPDPVCGDGNCDPGEDQCSTYCAADCGALPANETGLCTDGADNDCDGLVDCEDSDCAADAACQCAMAGESCQSTPCCAGLTCPGGKPSTRVCQ